MFKKIVLAFLIPTLIIGFYINASAKQELDSDGILKIGRVSYHPRRHYENLDHLGRYLVSQLGEQGIRDYKVIVPRNNAEMIHFINTDQIDLISESPFSAFLFERLANAEILLHEWKEGVPTERALFVTHINSGIESIEDMGGQSIAFEDPGSTVSYFIPRTILLNQGFKLEPYNETSDVSNTVDFSFAGTDLNVLYWLARGRVDAGVVSDSDWANQQRTPEGVTEELKVFHLSNPSVRSLILSRPDLDPLLKEALVETLIEMVNTEDGKAALKNYFKTTRFDPIKDKVATALEEMREQFHKYYPGD